MANSKRDASDTLTGAIKANAHKLLEGGEYFGKEDYVVNQLAEHYDEPKEDVRKRLQAAVEALPKKKVNPEDKRKKEAAAAAVKEAEEAQRFAVEAAEEARKKADIAAAAVAEAEGKVLVNVPKDFKLNIGGIIHDIKANTKTLPREHAEHEYSKAHGVLILGLPTEQAKA